MIHLFDNLLYISFGYVVSTIVNDIYNEKTLFVKSFMSILCSIVIIYIINLL
jgi:hypothetical protein